MINDNLTNAVLALGGACEQLPPGYELALHLRTIEGKAIWWVTLREFRKSPTTVNLTPNEHYGANAVAIVLDEAVLAAQRWAKGEWPINLVRHRMDIYSKPGTSVLFDANGGYQGEKENATETLVVGSSYTVNKINVGSDRSSVELVGHPGHWYNTVMFAAKDQQ